MNEEEKEQMNEPSGHPEYDGNTVVPVSGDDPPPPPPEPPPPPPPQSRES